MVPALKELRVQSGEPNLELSGALKDHQAGSLREVKLGLNLSVFAQ